MTGRRGGFTLVEILVALAILGVIVTIVSTTLGGSLSVQETAVRRAETTHAARTALDRLTQDVASAFTRAGQTGGAEAVGLVLEDLELEGAPRDRLTFPTYGRPIGGGDDPTSDTAYVEYWLDVSDDRREWRLARRESSRLTLEALARAPGDVVAERVVGFDVAVHDGKEWVAAWRNKGTLPRAVRVTVRVVGEPPEGASRPWGERPLSEARVFTYWTQVVLPLAKR